MTTITADIPSGGLDGDITRVTLAALGAGGTLDSAVYTPEAAITGRQAIPVVLYRNGFVSAALTFFSGAGGKSAAMNDRYLASGDVLSVASWAVGAEPSDPGGELVVTVTP